MRCGLRGGYVELVNVDPAVMKHVYTLFSKDSCAPVLAQIALNTMVNPPQPGDPSHPLYTVVRTEMCNCTIGFSYSNPKFDNCCLVFNSLFYRRDSTLKPHCFIMQRESVKL